ncbi:MAG: hypothetical protein SCARUB_01187 [Candidatus Scalindua rubra]|uniref:Uncharacterized protein n=1 Tax=Candidatus Scalindua rubra TaxID=1872076 RepID=A0A1E3XDF1_9BACT|nr:MAG: hypothetical protein SCARUB_01187 [Candidatus Scalindua rubra]
MVKVRTDGEYKYILECDKALPVGEQTVFHYRSLSLEEQYNMLGDDVEYERSGDGKLKAKIRFNKAGEIRTLITSITRIENLKDHSGNVIVWPNDEAGRKRILASLNGEWRAELAEAIRGGSTLDESEVKNSAPRSS